MSHSIVVAAVHINPKFDRSPALPATTPNPIQWVTIDSLEALHAAITEGFAPDLIIAEASDANLARLHTMLNGKEASVNGLPMLLYGPNANIYRSAGGTIHTANALPSDADALTELVEDIVRKSRRSARHEKTWKNLGDGLKGLVYPATGEIVSPSPILAFELEAIVPRTDPGKARALWLHVFLNVAEDLPPGWVAEFHYFKRDNEKLRYIILFRDTEGRPKLEGQMQQLYNDVRFLLDKEIDWAGSPFIFRPLSDADTAQWILGSAHPVQGLSWPEVTLEADLPGFRLAVDPMSTGIPLLFQTQGTSAAMVFELAQKECSSFDYCFRMRPYHSAVALPKGSALYQNLPAAWIGDAESYPKYLEHYRRSPKFGVELTLSAPTRLSDLLLDQFAVLSGSKGHEYFRSAVEPLEPTPIARSQVELLPIVPKSEWFNAKDCSFNLVGSDLELSQEGHVLGQVSGEAVRLSGEDLKRHLYVVGQTGTGKTSVLISIAESIMKRGEGLCVFDPHGDMVEDLISRVPKERTQDVMVFDPTDTENCPGLDFLRYDKAFPEQKSFIYNNLLSILGRFYNLSHVGGRMFELYLKNTLFLIMEERKGRLDEVEHVLSNREFRRSLLAASKNTQVKEFFAMAEKVSDNASLENMVPYVVSKLNRFTYDDYIGPLLRKEENRVDADEVLNSDRILFVRLNKSRLGGEGVSFAGSLLFNALLMAAYRRQSVPMEKRKPFTVILDEFQSFTSADVADALAETRKYNFRMVLANQNLGQLGADTQSAVIGNVGSIIGGRLGLVDAALLEQYFLPTYSAEVLRTLPNFHFLARLLVNNAPAQPFMFQSMPV